MKLLTWIVLLPIATLIIVFAVVNRELVPLNLWPLSYEINLPLFSVIFGGALIGVIWGGVAAWSAAGSARAKARNRGREVQRLEDENRRLKARVETFETEVREHNRAAAKSVVAGSDTKALPGAASPDAG